MSPADKIFQACRICQFLKNYRRLNDCLCSSQHVLMCWEILIDSGSPENFRPFISN